MNTRQLHVKSGPALLALTAFFWLNQPAAGQSAPAQNSTTQDRDTNRSELSSFDRFLDAHPEIAEQVRKDPSLVNKNKFVKNHPALRTYLQDHPGVREEIKENPSAFMHAENRFDRQEDRSGRDANRDVNRDRDANPDVNRDRDANRDTDRNRDANRDTGTNRDRDIDQDRGANQDRDLGRNRDRDAGRVQDSRGDRDTTRGELANFDRFLDSHKETGEQIRKNPSLINDPQFVKNHPALQTYLEDHPAIREEVTENPNSFMHAENRYDRQEDRLDRRDDRTSLSMDRKTGGMDRDAMHRHFGEFLGSHADVAKELSKNPSQVKNQAFVESHPDLKAYLNDNPQVRQELMANPHAFVKSSTQFSTKPPASTPPPKVKS